MPPTPEDPQLPSGVSLRTILFGHKDAISDIAWSADGRMIAGAAIDGSIRLWRTDGDAAPLVLEGHQARINSISWDPRGHDLVSASDDHSLRIWDTEKGAFKRSLTGHSQPIRSVLWSPNGNLLSTVHGKLIWVWEAGGGRLKGTLFDHDGHLRHVAWSPRGDLFASAADDKTIRLWDAWNLKVRGVLRGHEGAVNRLAWSPDGRQLVSAGEDHAIQVWDIKSGKCLKTLWDHNDPVKTVTWSPDGALIATMSRDKQIRIRRADTFKVIAVIHEETIPSNPTLAFHPKANILAGVGILDRMIRVWDLDVEVLYEEKNATGAGPEPSPRRQRPKAEVAKPPKSPPVEAAPSAKPAPPPDPEPKPKPKPEPKPDPEPKSRAQAASKPPPQKPAEPPAPEADAVYRNAKVVLVGGTKAARSKLFATLTGRGESDSENIRVAVMSTRKGVAENELVELYLWDPPESELETRTHRAYVEDAQLVLLLADETDHGAQSTAAIWARHLGFLLETAVIFMAGESEDVPELLQGETFNGDLSHPGQRTAFEDRCFNLIPWPSGDQNPVTARAFEQTLAFISRERKYPLAQLDDLYKHFKHGIGHDLGDLEPKTFRACLARAAAAGAIFPLGFQDLYLLRPDWLDAYLECVAHAMPVAGLIPSARRPRHLERELITAVMERLLNPAILPAELVAGEPIRISHADHGRLRPVMEERDDETVVFKVKVEVFPIFASLLTRLSYLEVFEGLMLWRNGAVLTHGAGGGCGLHPRENHSGDGSVAVFFEKGAGTRTQVWFEEYVYAFLVEQAGADAVARHKVFLCESCGEAITAKQAKRRREMGLDFINCPVCETRVSLLDRMERLSPQAAPPKPAKSRRNTAKRETPADLQSWVGAERTILALIFTDIVGSTDLGNRLGNEGMRSVRRAHFKKGRTLLGEYDAYEVKTIGDSLMLAFRTAVDALDYALQFFEDTGHEEVRIRIGLHVGPVEVEESDLFGAMVNYCSRVEGQAVGAELWISNEAYNHVAQQGADRHKDIPWTRHEKVRLKGFEGDHRLWSLTREDP